jgi:hypothetical protein
VANKVTESVRTKLWLASPDNVSNWERDGAHFATNARHDHACGASVLDDGVWVDDQLWAVVNGVATAEQSATIKQWLANRTADYEGVPTRWSSKGSAAAEQGRYGVRCPPGNPKSTHQPMRFVIWYGAGVLTLGPGWHRRLGLAGLAWATC